MTVARLLPSSLGLPRGGGGDFPSNPSKMALNGLQWLGKSLDTWSHGGAALWAFKWGFLGSDLWGFADQFCVFPLISSLGSF